ncbi:MAG: phenylalanine 4-monooxygenase [Pseudomonadota bacterium]
MERPGSAHSESGLRGDYARAAADYTVPQRWNEYTAEQNARWRRLYGRQAELAGQFASQRFLSGLARLDCAEAIPRFADADRALGDTTGWQLVAVPGFIPDDAFFAHLAARRFPVTRWLREESELDYLAEPDVFHDVFGHVPMLFDPAIADFLEAYGHAGERAVQAGALDLLARLYWYTIEFGLVFEEGHLKAFGAGIVSSAGELVFAVTDKTVPRLPFNPLRVMRTDYRIDAFQDCYFVLESVDQLMRELLQLDLGPLYERWRSVPPVSPGTLLPGETSWHAVGQPS